MNDIIVKKIAEIPPYAGEHAIPGIRFRPARDALGVTSWGMNVIELDPHCSGYPDHHHAADGHEEAYLVVRGTIDLQAGDRTVTLSEGDFVRVAPETRRKFVTRDSAATLLALGGTPGKPYTPSMGGR